MLENQKHCFRGPQREKLTKLTHPQIKIIKKSVKSQLFLPKNKTLDQLLSHFKSKSLDRNDVQETTSF